MNKTLHIIGISGSLRKGSFNTALLRAATMALPEEVTLEIVEIGDLPLYNGDLEQPLPAPVARLKQQIKAADGILLASPEYNFSVSGVLKNAIDWASRPYGQNSFDGKPVAIMGASGGMFGTARMQYDMRKIFVELNAHAMGKPEMMVTAAQEKFDESGALKDEKTKQKLREFLGAFVGWIRRIGISE